MIKLRFTKINPCERSTGSQFAKLNPRKMLKNWLAKINPRENVSLFMAGRLSFAYFLYRASEINRIGRHRKARNTLLQETSRVRSKVTPGRLIFSLQSRSCYRLPKHAVSNLTFILFLTLALTDYNLLVLYWKC